MSLYGWSANKKRSGFFPVCRQSGAIAIGPVVNPEKPTNEVDYGVRMSLTRNRLRFCLRRGPSRRRKENKMKQTIESKNKELVLEAFDTLFNKRQQI
jgi:hypothetical protein